MAELLVGAVAAAGLLTLIRYARSKGLAVAWWGWTLTVLAFIYSVFVVEVILSFLREGSGKAATMMGTLLGFFAVIWAVLLARFVFSRRTRRGKEVVDV